jgi:hypothetical protein
VQESKLQARIESDDWLRQQKRDAERDAREKIRKARDKFD